MDIISFAVLVVFLALFLFITFIVHGFLVCVLTIRMVPDISYNSIILGTEVIQPLSLFSGQVVDEERIPNVDARKVVGPHKYFAPIIHQHRRGATGYLIMQSCRKYLLCGAHEGGECV